MMRICHVITGLNVGGAELALCGLLETLGQPDSMVVVLGGPGPLSARVAALAELHHVGMHAGRAGPRDLLRLRRIMDTRIGRPDVVHAWMYHANLMSSLALAGTGIPLIWGVHHSLSDLASEKRGTRAVIRVNALLSRAPDRIRYVSAVAAAQHQRAGFAPGRTVVIPNGYDMHRFRPDPDARSRMRREFGIPEDALTIGMVARVHPTKDHDNFLQAAAYFLIDHPDAMFLLAGEGAERDNPQLSGSIERMGLRPHIRLCGRREDIAAVYSALDIAALSSRGEAFPNAVAEAMACGVPCVSTDVGDAATIIGATGIVVRPRDAAALADGWEQLAALDAAARQALGMRARQRITELFAREAIGHRFSDLYQELVTSRGKTH